MADLVRRRCPAPADAKGLEEGDVLAVRRKGEVAVVLVWIHTTGRQGGQRGHHLVSGRARQVPAAAVEVRGGASIRADRVLAVVDPRGEGAHDRGGSGRQARLEERTVGRLIADGR